MFLCERNDKEEKLTKQERGKFVASLPQVTEWDEL